VTSPLQLVVTNTNDAGAGSLRAAMLAANATPNVREEIRFSIPGPGPHRINLLSPLPAVTDPLFVNGTSQAGYAGVPLVEVSGPATPLITGFTIFAGNSRVNGLSLIGFGTALVLRNGGSNIVDGNYIGLSTNGTIAANALGIFITSSANNRIGGPTAAERNVISGNTQRGMEIRDASSGNRVINNYIGTSPDGLLARPNGTAGVEVVGASANTIGEPGAGNLISGNVRGVSLGLAATNNRVMANLIGTTRAGDQPLSNTELGIAVFADANTIGGTTFGEGNVISANGAGGILITNGLGGTGNGNFVYGNSIGLGIDAIQLGNGGAGVSIQGGAMNTIGGVTPASRNLIGSNARNGVVIAGATATGNVVAGNYIGLDDSGSSARPNFGVGVLVQNASGNRIGVIGGGNVLSGNLEAGIAFDHSDDNDVVGNRIGTTADGIEARPNGFVLEDGSVTGAGITLVQSPGNRIGSAAPGGGNLISGNGTGIWVEDAASAGTIITGNMIGTNAAGNSGIPNAVGLSLAGSATVGGIQPGAPNVISANTTTGILVAGNGTSVDIQENVISGNGGLGIDLGGDGVTRNDPGDVDEGSNHNQNVPVLTGVTAFSAATRIVGTLDSTPSSTFTLRFYANDSCDPSGFGEGQRSLGATTVSTDGAGSASFDVGVGRSGAGDVLTATATDGAGNTSEFSACRQASQWSAFLPPGTAAETTVTNPRSGNASLELLTARESSALINEPGTVFGNFADLNALSFDWAIDPASQGALPPDLALRVYAFGDPRSFFLHWDTCGPSVPCTFREKGSWQTTNLIGQLSIQADGSNTPPASLAEIPPDAPITGIHVRSAYNFGYPWFGYADNVVIGFRGQQPNVFNFELADPSASRIRPALTWTRPASIDDATALSAEQLNAFGSTTGSFEYDPTAGTGLSADLHGLFTTFTAADASKYLPVSRAVPLTVTGLATVVPEDSSWFAFTPAADTAAAITLNNPRSGNGSLELTKTSNQGSAYLHEPNVLSLGAVSDLTSLSMDWFIDPASEAQLPPELALRVYDFGDPRSFFLYWDTCSGLTPCDPQPTGSWQTTNLIGRLRIQAAEGAAPPPASLAEIPPDAPIVGIHLRTNFGNGRPWHGFVDNVAIGFGGRSPIVFNFEPFGVIQQ